MFYGKTNVPFANTGVGTQNGSAIGSYCFDIGAVMKIGRCRKVTPNYVGYYGNDIVNYNLNPGVYFGSGSTPASKDDNCLENPIESGLEITSPNDVSLVSDGNGMYSISSRFLVANTGDTDATIQEIGLISSVCDSSGFSNSKTLVSVLFERTVLEAPVTIPAGEARLIEYKLTFNQS